jgi:hypothetical protein
MNYAAFKTHLADFLWKTNDADLIAALDNLIVMANAELNRKTAQMKRREVTVTITMVANEYTLPADLKYVDSISTTDNGPFSKSTRNQYEADALLVGIEGGATCRYYDEGSILYIAGTIDAVNTLDVELTYHNYIPDYSVADASWFEEEFLDVYTYGVLKHTAPYLREDDRLTLWISMYDDALTSMLEDDMFHVAYGGSPLYTNSPRKAP